MGNVRKKSEERKAKRELAIWDLGFWNRETRTGMKGEEKEMPVRAR
jgi:hypothetical protein